MSLLPRAASCGVAFGASALKLTFDDGPDPLWTPRLLDLLAELGARATFFVLAPRAAAQPALVARMLAEGHTVGVHCDRHDRHSCHDRAWVERDLAGALARLAPLGARPSLWRTPWGDTAPFTAALAARHGLQLVGWDVDTHDWRGDRAQAMFAATREQLQPGAVVLAHDGIGPGARRAGAEQTLAYVALAAQHARTRGLSLGAL
jgi:peptidoglycan/xylan/chitin deacetylase (PgdA/CDA1 family)